MKVYVLTSNNYVHVLPAFAHLFNRMWGDNQPVVVAGYDNRPLNLPRNFAWHSIGKQDDYQWSGGLLKLLSTIPEDLILLVLEDYFLSAPVDTVKVALAWQYMLRRPDVVKIDLSDDRLKLDYTDYTDPSAPPGMILSGGETLFQMSTQAAIWRKDFLSRFLYYGENAWMAEKRGTKRIIDARRNGEFNGKILGFKQPPMTYINAIGGMGNMPNTWAWKYFPPWMSVELKAKGLL